MAKLTRIHGRARTTWLTRNQDDLKEIDLDELDSENGDVQTSDLDQSRLTPNNWGKGHRQDF